MKKLFIYITTIVLTITTTIASANSHQEISQLITQYESALNNSNPEQVIRLYSQTPVFMPQHAPAQIGRDQIKQAYQAVFNSIKLDINFSVHQVEVYNDTAWVRTSSAGKTTILANKQVINEGNNEMFILKKEQGHWRIHQYIFSTNQARQP